MREETTCMLLACKDTQQRHVSQRRGVSTWPWWCAAIAQAFPVRKAGVAGRDHDSVEGGPCGGLGPACLAHDNTTGGAATATGIIVVLETAGLLCFTFSFLLFLSHTVRTPRLQNPICCMKDHTVPVSNQTTLAGARPLLCPPTHTSTASRRASSTRQRRHSGSSLVGRTWYSTRTLVVRPAHHQHWMVL